VLLVRKKKFENIKRVIKSHEVEGQTTAERKHVKQKRQIMVDKTLHRKLKIGQHEPIKIGDELRCSGRVSKFLVHPSCYYWQNSGVKS
jgi:hypothetical protein